MDRPPERPSDVIANFEALPWQERVGYVETMMREVSRQTDPARMVEVYGSWISRIRPSDGFVSLSRRDLLAPWYRITRSQLWEDRDVRIDPWKDREKLPLLDRGILGEILYGEKARVIQDFQVAPDDPAHEHLKGYRSLMAMPMFENGVAVNMIVRLDRRPDAFDPEGMPEWLWQANLFGRATKNLVLTQELQKAYEIVERELKVVSDIQRSLLPSKLPEIQGLDIAAFYQTSTQAGGDYYDFFELEDGKLGILIADVSGHGTPAAVMMAVTHSIAHTRDEPPTPPCSLLNFINRQLTRRYTTSGGTFVTAFYGIYDPQTRVIHYCSAGHNPPRVRRAGGNVTIPLDGNRNLPLGIIDDEVYTDAECQLQPGDTLIFYTDGITEARDHTGELFGTERLDEVVQGCGADAKQLVHDVMHRVNTFSGHIAPKDDQTLVVARILK